MTGWETTTVLVNIGPDSPKMHSYRQAGPSETLGPGFTKGLKSFYFAKTSLKVMTFVLAKIYLKLGFTKSA